MSRTPNRCQPVPAEVRQTADLLERRWQLSIIYAALSGALRFNEFAEAVAGISPRMLSERLREPLHLLHREPDAQLPFGGRACDWAPVSDSVCISVCVCVAVSALVIPAPTLTPHPASPPQRRAHQPVHRTHRARSVDPPRAHLLLHDLLAPLHHVSKLRAGTCGVLIARSASFARDATSWRTSKGAVGGERGRRRHFWGGGLAW